MTRTTTRTSGAARVFTDTEDHDLVQRRLGVVAGVIGVIALTFWVLGFFLTIVFLPRRFW